MTTKFWIVRLALLSILVIHHQNALSAAPQQTQLQDDHNDSAPIQSGYAVITPSLAATGISVMETFGLRQAGGAIQGSIEPPPLILSGLMFINESVRLSKDVGIAVVNPNNGLANVTFTVRKNDGTQLLTKSVQIAARRQTVQFLTEIFPAGSAGSSNLPTEFVGTVQIDSTVPVSVMGLRFRDDNFSPIPLTPLTTFVGTLPILTTGVGGTGATLLPLFVANGGWASEIAIINTNPTSVTIRLDLYKEDGSNFTTGLNGQNVFSVTNVTIPAHGVVVYTPRDRNGDDDF